MYVCMNYYINIIFIFHKQNIQKVATKENSDIFSKILTDDLNNSITTAKFPDNLKCADITPAFKKDDWLIKSNYRPISILPTSKIYEKGCLQTNIPIF